VIFQPLQPYISAVCRRGTGLMKSTACRQYGRRLRPRPV